MSITDTATGTTAHERTFWRSDYARFARAIRRTRHVMGDEHTAKSAGHQARCDELAGAVAALFQADAPGAFSGEKFRAGTLLAGALPAPKTARTTPRSGATPTLTSRTKPARTSRTAPGTTSQWSTTKPRSCSPRQQAPRLYPRTGGRGVSLPPMRQPW